MLYAVAEVRGQKRFEFFPLILLTTLFPRRRLDIIQTVMISIIVPIYNAQAYIDQCIKSVLNQSFQDIELILINDGSTDESLKKCHSWEDDPRVIIISTENHGVSFARNLGLQKASGKWVMFLDSDDYLLDNCLEDLMAMVSPDTQEVIAAYIDNGPEYKKALHQSVTADSVRRMSLDNTNNQLLPAFYEVKPLSLSACWSKLFRNDVIRENAVGFHEELQLSEDTLFNLDYLACIDNVIVSNLPVVYYRRNTSSVTKVFAAKHLADRFRFFNILKERKYRDAPVHIISLLFFEICKIERYSQGTERKRLEKEIVNYLSENVNILNSIRNLSLSSGKWQNPVYMAAAICFRYKVYCAGFALLRIYSVATQGEINKLTAKG